MSEAGDRGFLFRTSGLALLILAVWQLGEAGGVLAAKEQLLANREAMVKLAPLFLLGLFFLRGPLPMRRSVARVAGFQFLNLGFLVAAAIYGLAAVPLGVEFPIEGQGEGVAETSWALRDRLQDVEGKMAQLDRETAQVGELPEGATDSKRRDVGKQKTGKIAADGRVAGGAGEINGGARSPSKSCGGAEGKAERSVMAERLARAQRGSGGVAVLFVFLGLHGLFVGFIGRGWAFDRRISRGFE